MGCCLEVWLKQHGARERQDGTRDNEGEVRGEAGLNEDRVRVKDGLRDVKMQRSSVPERSY